MSAISRHCRNIISSKFIVKGQDMPRMQSLGWTVGQYRTGTVHGTKTGDGAEEGGGCCAGPDTHRQDVCMAEDNVR